MADTGVNYTVTVTKQGDGATQAANELKALQGAAAQTNAALNTSNTGLATLGATTKATTTTMRAMSGVMAIAGLQTFPQLTTAAMLTKNSLDAVRMSGANVTMGLGLMSAGVAGLAAAVVSATFAWGAYTARQEEGLSGVRLADQTRRFMETFREQLGTLREQGRITEETFRSLSEQLRTPPREAATGWFGTAINAVQDQLDNRPMLRLVAAVSGLNMLNTLGRSGPSTEGLQAFNAELDRSIKGVEQVRDGIAKIEVPTAATRLATMQRQFAYNDAYAALNQPKALANDKRQQELDLETRFNKERQIHNQLLAQGLITTQQLSDLNMEADTRRMQSLTRLNAQLTQTQQLARQGAEAFASGLGSAMVNAFTEGGKAFRQFASQFLAQMAQMIAQAMIMRVLFGATGAASGTGGLIGGLINGAASGGVFGLGGVRYMAMGGIATVNQATYLPKFNTVAGEAGREMLTVLARPRFMEVGGMQAVVGNAGGNRLAITNADALAAGAGGMGGGTAEIVVRMEPGLRGEIVENSIQGSVLRVTRDMSRDTPLSRATKQL